LMVPLTGRSTLREQALSSVSWASGNNGNHSSTRGRLWVQVLFLYSALGRGGGIYVTVELAWGAATDVGLVRAENEDSHTVGVPIFAVADGMGGHAGGALASQLAVAALQRSFDGVLPTADDVIVAIDRGNRAILDSAAAGELAGMGTTLVGLALVADGPDTYWFGFNVGDSRLYRFAGGRCEQVSVDHAESGHLLTRALGLAPSADVDCWLLLPVPGERFLLCSDGLHGELSHERIVSLLGRTREPAEAAEALVRAAIDAGGRDNVTAVVVDVLGAAAADVDATTVERRTR